jgi:hypothetical protein
MDLAGQGSNPDLAGRIEAIVGRARDATGGPATGAVAENRSVRRRRRSWTVSHAIITALGSGEEMGVKDIHVSVEMIVGERVSASSVKNWLAKHCVAPSDAVRRTGRGRYQLRRDA